MGLWRPVPGSNFAPDNKPNAMDTIKATLLAAAVALTSASCAVAQTAKDTVVVESKSRNFFNRLNVGGYGEAVMTRNFYSDNYLRYTTPEKYRDESHGRVDLPHVVIFLGYDFGKGWSMGSEIEFEHGGTESAVEIEEEEAGEYESEIERGGEVALEQFWIQKSFMPQLNVRVGHMVVPVGYTNTHHLPTEFFGVYRPSGENTIMPCTWHETGISLWGRIGAWRYEAMFMPGLDSERFGSSSWIKNGSASPYEFKISNGYAGAIRIDNYSVRGLRIGLSGYVGSSFKNTLYANNKKEFDKVKGIVSIISADFTYQGYNVLARGHYDFGHLSDAAKITRFNMGMPQASPSKHQTVASEAVTAGVEAGYNIFGLSRNLTARGQKLYIFGQWDYYNSMYKMDDGGRALKWTKRNTVTFGLNYFPIKDIVIKGEYSVGILDKPYNNEPSLSLGVAYAGWFL